MFRRKPKRWKDSTYERLLRWMRVRRLHARHQNIWDATQP